jgi:hypothetical protein
MERFYREQAREMCIMAGEFGNAIGSATGGSNVYR